jgi:hypothetical protein
MGILRKQCLSLATTQPAPLTGADAARWRWAERDFYGFGLRGVLGAQRVALRAARELESCVVIRGAGSAGVGKCRGAHQKFADADHSHGSNFGKKIGEISKASGSTR